MTAWQHWKLARRDARLPPQDAIFSLFALFSSGAFMSQPAVTQPVEAKKGSPVRLIVLLGILGIVLTAFLVDMFVMYDSVKAAEKRLVETSRELAQKPFEANGESPYLTREAVAKVIGFAPTNSTAEGGQLKEYYRWWGALPLQRRFIEVIYKDEEGTRYDHFQISNSRLFGPDDDELLRQEAERLQQQSPPVAPESQGPTDMLTPGAPGEKPVAEPDSATPSSDPGAEKPASDPATPTADPEK